MSHTHIQLCEIKDYCLYFIHDHMFTFCSRGHRASVDKFSQLRSEHLEGQLTTTLPLLVLVLNFEKFR